MDQALEKQYNKLAKGQSGIIGITRRKEAVCKWNIIKHEKGQYRDFLQKICGFDTNDGYSIHHEFGSSITKRDQEAVEQMVEYVDERGGLLNLDQNKITNICTGVYLDREASEFHLGCKTIGEEEYGKFKSKRLEKKTVKLFYVIPKVRKKKSNTHASNTVDLKKETVSFVRHIDFLRLRIYNIQRLLQFEITSTSFFLTKDGYLRKSQKSQLAQEIKGLLPAPPEMVPTDRKQSMTVFDFMGYCRKVPIKRDELKTYADLANHLWITFTFLSKNHSIIDIVFDLYLDASIKEEERLRRSKDKAIEVNISSYHQVSYFDRGGSRKMSPPYLCE